MVKFTEPISTSFLGSTRVALGLDEPEFKYGIKIFGRGTYGLGQGRTITVLTGQNEWQEPAPSVWQAASETNWQDRDRPGFEETLSTNWHTSIETIAHLEKDAENWQLSARDRDTSTFAWGLGRWGCGDWGIGEGDSTSLFPWMSKSDIKLASEVETVTFMERAA